MLILICFCALCLLVCARCVQLHYGQYAEEKAQQRLVRIMQASDEKKEAEAKKAAASSAASSGSK